MCFEAIARPFAGLGLDGEGCAAGAGDGTGSVQVHAAGVHKSIRLLRNIAIRFEAGDAAGGNIAGGDAVVHHFDSEVFLRTAAQGVRIGLDGGFRRAHAAELRRQVETPGVDVAAAALADGAAGNGRAAGAVGESAVHEHISIAAVHIECAAGFISQEADADAVVRFHGILVHRGLGLFFHQLVIIFLLQAQGVPEAFRLLGELYDLGVGDVELFRNADIAHRAGLVRVGDGIVGGDDGAAVQLSFFTQLVIGDGRAPLQEILFGGRLVLDAPPVELAFVELVGGGVTLVLSGLEGVVAPRRRIVDSALAHFVGDLLR